jgi:hypothetical protein
MSTRVGQYLNEIVSLSVLMLMALALIAGRAGTSVDGAAYSDVSMSVSAPVVAASALVEAGSSAITQRIDLVLDEVAESLPVHETTEAIVEVVGNISVLGK